jgi:hypothetical protein
VIVFVVERHWRVTGAAEEGGRLPIAAAFAQTGHPGAVAVASVARHPCSLATRGPCVRAAAAACGAGAAGTTVKHCW